MAKLTLFQATTTTNVVVDVLVIVVTYCFLIWSIFFEMFSVLLFEMFYEQW